MTFTVHHVLKAYSFEQDSYVDFPCLVEVELVGGAGSVRRVYSKVGPLIQDFPLGVVHGDEPELVDLAREQAELGSAWEELADPPAGGGL